MHIIINEHGTTLSRKDGDFFVRKPKENIRLEPKRLTSIMISPGTRITSDAIILAVEHNVDILFMDESGEPQGRIWSHKYGSVSTIRKSQLRFSESDQALGWIQEVIGQRLNGAIRLLTDISSSKPPDEAITTALETLAETAQNIQALPPQYLSDELKASMRGWEGQAVHTYFRALSALLPVEYQFDRRSRRPAKDMFNAVLNYLYGILYGRVEIALIIAGIDPYLGIFHRNEYNRPVLVYDLIEAYRPWAETIAMQICCQNQITPDMFSQKKGGYWLEAPGKQVVIQSMHDFLEEQTQYQQRQYRRSIQIRRYCTELADRFVKATS